MTFTIPNEASASFASQSELDTQDLRILADAINLRGVVTGLDVTAAGGMTLAVSSGEASYPAVYITYAGGTVNVSAAHATLPRYDIVVISILGVVSVVAGTASAKPVFPTFSNNLVALAAIHVPAGVTSLTSGNIVQKNVSLLNAIIPQGKVGGQSLTGGVGASESLSLNSTSHGTKGKISFDDSNFYAEILTTIPRIFFDALDRLEFSRTTNIFSFNIGGTIALETAITQSKVNGELVIDNDGLTTDDVFVVGALSSVRPGITFDAGTDALFYDRTSNYLELRIANATMFQSNTTNFLITTAIEIDGALNHDGTTIGFFGVPPAVRASAYTPTNVTPDRAFDADTVAVAELADVVGTLIADLQTYGLLQ